MNECIYCTAGKPERCMCIVIQNDRAEAIRLGVVPGSCNCGNQGIFSLPCPVIGHPPPPAWVVSSSSTTDESKAEAIAEFKGGEMIKLTLVALGQYEGEEGKPVRFRLYREGLDKNRFFNGEQVMDVELEPKDAKQIKLGQNYEVTIKAVD